MAEPSTSANEEFLFTLGEDYFNNEDLDAYLLQNYAGKIVKLTKENLNELKRPLVIAFHHFKKDYQFLKEWTDILYEAALKYEGRIQYAVADFKDLSLVNYRMNTSLRPDYWSPWVCAIDEQNRTYKLNDFYGFYDFCEKLLNGELYQSIPAENDGLVKVIVADNFEEHVVKSDKDVFVLIYYVDNFSAEELVPRLDELAEILKDENILIAKMDGVKNYQPIEYDICSYPKCLYFLRADKSKFNRPRRPICSAEGLMKFIALNSSEELRDYDRKGLKHSEI